MLRLGTVLVLVFGAGCAVDTSALAPGDASVGEDASPDAADTGSPDTSGGCPGEERLCGGRCVDVASDPLHCGRCDAPCPAPPENATATCAEGTCAVACDAGWAPDDSGGCVPNECGDGYLDASEACDDANTASGDGCSHPDCGAEDDAGLCGETELRAARATQSYRGRLVAGADSGMACDLGGQDQVFMVAVDFVGNLRVRVTPTGFTPLLTVYDSRAGCPGMPLACVTGAGEGIDAQATVRAVTTGGHYLVVVSSTADLGSALPADFVLELTGF